MKTFTYYPQFHFYETEPFHSTCHITGYEPKERIDESILFCRLADKDNFDYVYYKDIKRLFKIEGYAGMFCNVVKDIRTNHYNLMSTITGKLRFDLDNQPVVYCKSTKHPKIQMFGYCIKTAKEFHYEWIDSLLIFDYNKPISSIPRVIYDRDNQGQ